MTHLLLILLPLLALTAPLADAHSRLISPRPRVGGFIGDFTGYTSPPCGDMSLAARAGIQPQTTVKRGDTLPVTWPRNNHPGGFIKISLIPLNRATVESQAAFDANVIQFSCHEATCKSGYTGAPLAGDGDGVPEDGNICATSVKIPEHLTDGDYTMQWMWFAGGSFFGDINRGQTSYYGCSDLRVSGGSSFSPSAKPACPTFVAGDAHNPASKGVCKYFGNGEPLGCNPDGCRGEYKDGVPPPLSRCLAQNPSATTSTRAPPAVPASAATGAPAIAPAPASPSTATPVPTSSATSSASARPTATRRPRRRTMRSRVTATRGSGVVAAAAVAAKPRYSYGSA